LFVDFAGTSLRHVLPNFKPVPDRASRDPGTKLSTKEDRTLFCW
jgi:hypothetical protein